MRREQRCFCGERCLSFDKVYFPRVSTEISSPKVAIFVSPAKNVFPTLVPLDVFPHLSRYPPRARSPKRRVPMRFRLKNLARAADAVGDFSPIDVEFDPRAVLFDHIPALSGGSADGNDAQLSRDVFVPPPACSMQLQAGVCAPVSEVPVNHVSDSAVMEQNAGAALFADVDDCVFGCGRSVLPYTRYDLFIDDSPPELLSDTDSDADNDSVDSSDFDYRAAETEPFFDLHDRVFGGNFQTAPARALPTTAVFMNTAEVVLGIAGVDSDRVLVDSGASIHATSRRELCFDVVSCSVSIAGVGGVAFRCVERGSLIFQPSDDGRAGLPPLVLTDVHISPEFPTTFISESKLVRKGASVLKNPSGGQVTNDDGLMFRLREYDGLYYAVGSLCAPPTGDALHFGVDDLPGTPFSCEDVPAALCWLDKCNLDVGVLHEGDSRSLFLAKTYSKRDVSDLLGRYHRRMSHMSFKRVASSFGMTLPPGFEPPLCNACVMGKQKNIPHHEGARLKATRPCAGLHIDFCGPFPHISRYGNRYLLIFKCDFTGFVWDYYTRSQSEFYEILVALVARLSNQFSLQNVVIWIRSDNGKVFTEGQVASFCLSKGIRHEFSAPYSQWQNGSAERMFQTVLNLSVAALHQSGFVHSLLLGRCGSPGRPLHQ